MQYLQCSFIYYFSPLVSSASSQSSLSVSLSRLFFPSSRLSFSSPATLNRRVARACLRRSWLNWFALLLRLSGVEVDGGGRLWSTLTEANWEPKNRSERDELEWRIGTVIFGFSKVLTSSSSSAAGDGASSLVGFPSGIDFLPPLLSPVGLQARGDQPTEVE